MKITDVREFVISGLKIKAVQDGEHTSILVQDGDDKTVFRGAIIFKSWPRIKGVFDSLWQGHDLDS